ncbi:MAG: DUF3634 family protein [Spirulina sp.]
MARSGKVPARFLHGCEAIASMYELPDGRIKAYASQSGISFIFSRSIPRRYHQKFRNVWYTKY